jgi:hypothetical protein
MFDVPDDSDSNVPRLRVSLRIRGAALDPEFLTQHLGVAPTFTARQEATTKAHNSRPRPLPAQSGVALAVSYADERSAGRPHRSDTVSQR